MDEERADGDSQVCIRCIGDEFLKTRIRNDGDIDDCFFCGKKRRCITISDLAKWVEAVLDDRYEEGETYFVFDSEGEKSHEEQEGELLDDLVANLLEIKQEHIGDAVTTILSEVPYHLAKYGEEPRYSSEKCYVEKGIYMGEIEREWANFGAELKHRSRFFNEHARSFLDRIMKDVHELRAYGGEGADSVIRELNPKNTPSLFRARRADYKGDIGRIRASLQNELGPPPPERAKAGRMNAEGVSVFYGALDRATCVAELRPYLKSTALSAEFKLKRSIRVLDFQMLERSYHDKPLSHFQPDFISKAIDRKFLRNLHSRIRRPILPGDEHEYLVTQVLSEYLASILDPPIDGVIFSSVQRQDGSNVVLFGRVLDIDIKLDRRSIMGKKSVLEIDEKSVFVHRITAINYDFGGRNLDKLSERELEAVEAGTELDIDFLDDSDN